MNRDPIGYEGSEWSLYEYALSNPGLNLDPKGSTTLFQALRICAAERTLLLKVKCICTLLPESPACRNLTNGYDHLKKLRDALGKLKEYRDVLRKAKNAKERKRLQELIDKLINEKKGIKGHVKEIKQQWCKKKGQQYPDDFLDELKKACEEDKEICKYLEKLLGKK